MYPEEMVRPMKAELVDAGFQDLHTAEAVENAIKGAGTTLVVVNSVCGCAARNARPGAKMSLEGAKKPDHLITVFAGVDKEAVDEASVDKLDQEAKIYFMQQVKQGKIKELPKDPKAEYMKVKMTKKELKEVIREQIKNLTK